MTTVTVTPETPLLHVRINRPEARNAVDRSTALALADAFRAFDADPTYRVALLSGAGGTFCAGADLKAVAAGQPERLNRIDPAGDSPMGPCRMVLSKPVIAVISGYCVAGGLELALWCDLRIADETAVFGVFCRRFGVPLIDGGTVRLPRLIGMSRAMDMILTGRAVDAEEALSFGLVNRLVAREALDAESARLAREIAAHPQVCMRNDRRAALEQWGLQHAEAMRNEFQLGVETLASGEPVAGAGRFRDGAGRQGRFDET